jgi:serine/threonine-protein kinase
MELLEGETLRERLGRGPLPLPEVLEVARQIVRGLAAAHEKGITHRDLKPANLFLTKGGHVKILDFGLAKQEGPQPLRHEDETADVPTAPGAVMGTLGYMSPEQARGLEADARSDLFALGTVVYEMLAGRKAFRGDTVSDALVALLTRDPDPLPEEVPAGVERVVMRCLDKRPEGRFQSADELAAALERTTEPSPSASRAVGAPPPDPRWRRSHWGLLGAALLLLLGTVLTFDLGGLRSKWFAPKPATPARSIAVLPFVDPSGDREQEYFSDGLTEELIGLLTQVGDLHVAGRTSSFAFKGRDAELAEIGRVLNVATVLEGSVRRSGDRLRVSARLVSVDDGFQLWAESYDRTVTDVFAVQDEIAGAVVAALKIKLLPGVGPSSPDHRTSNPEAYTQYLLGRQFHNRGSRENWRRAIEAYESAIRLDPTYAAAYARLALTEIFMASYAETAAEAVEREQRGRVAAERAIELDPALAQGYSMRGYIRGTGLPLDWAGAQADFEKALALDPGDADTHVSFSLFLANVGRMSEAIAEAKRAADLDPLSARAWRNLGNYLNVTGDSVGARKALDRALEINPDDFMTHLAIGWTLLREGDPKAALAKFSRGPEADRLTGTAMAEHALGDARASQRALDELIAKHPHFAPFQIASVYAWRGQKDEAFEWLDRAYLIRDPGLTTLKAVPFFDGLVSDSRYQDLLRRMNLPADRTP